MSAAMRSRKAARRRGLGQPATADRLIAPILSLLIHPASCIDDQGANRIDGDIARYGDRSNACMLFAWMWRHPDDAGIRNNAECGQSEEPTLKSPPRFEDRRLRRSAISFRPRCSNRQELLMGKAAKKHTIATTIRTSQEQDQKQDQLQAQANLQASCRARAKVRARVRARANSSSRFSRWIPGARTTTTTTTTTTTRTANENERQQQARQQGRERGRQRARQQGREQARQQGRQQHRQQDRE